MASAARAVAGDLRRALPPVGFLCLRAGRILMVCLRGLRWLRTGHWHHHSHRPRRDGTSPAREEEFSLSERTLVLIKPDGVRRGLVGDVLSRIERKGLRIVAMDLRTLDPDTAQTHYAEHSSKTFFGSLVEFITSGPLVAVVAEGPRAIEAFRALAGATDPVRAAPGTIRGDHALEVQDNIVHGSDSPDSAEREIKIFFPDLV